MFRYRRDILLLLSVQTGRRKPINHRAWHQLPVFVPVCRLPTRLRCCGSRPHAVWLWLSARRCCRSAAPPNSALPASPTPATSAPQQAAHKQQTLSTGSCLLAPVVPRCARHQNFPPAALNFLSQVVHHCLWLHKALNVGSGVSAAFSFWHGGFETRPWNKCENT